MTYSTPFKHLIPPLQHDEYELLEKSIIAEGCREAIILWGDIIIDGHNRYEICAKHGIDYITSTRNFDNRDDAKLWIINNQFARRNLSAYQRGVLALQYEDIIRARAKEKQIEAGETKLLQNSAEAIETRQELARIAGVSHDTIAKIKTIEAKAPQEAKDRLNSGDASIHQVWRDIRRNEQKQHRQENLTSPDLPNDKYQVIYADPPWAYNDKQNIETLGGAEKHYPTMSIQELCELPISEMTLSNAVLFIWVTSPLLEEVFEVIGSWGFKYKSSFVWDKVKHNMGHYNSVRHEFLLIATKGSCTPDNIKLFDSVQTIERTDHSSKPEEFYDIIETLYGGKKVELFARNKRNGWDTWGNEIND